MFDEYRWKRYQSEVENFKQKLLTKNRTILMRWMKVSFLNQQVKARNRFADSASAIMLNCSGAERRFGLFNFIVIITKNSCSPSHVDENTITGNGANGNLRVRSVDEGFHANYTLLQRFSSSLDRYVLVFYLNWAMFSF